MDRDNVVRMGCGVVGWAGGRSGERKNWDNYNIINKNFKKTDICGHFKEIFLFF